LTTDTKYIGEIIYDSCIVYESLCLWSSGKDWPG